MVTARKRTAASSVLRVSCLLTDQIGDAVYIRSQANGFYKVAKADVTTTVKMPIIGVIVAKWNYTNAVVHLEGELKDIYTGLQPGRTYFVGPDARPNISPPSPTPDGLAYCQVIGVALDIATLLVRPASNLIVRVGS